MALYTVSISQSGAGSVSIGDGTLLAKLSVAAGRGPKGDAGINVTITVVADRAAFDAATPSATELVVLYA